MAQVKTLAATGALHAGPARVGVIVLSAGAGAAARCTLTDATAGSGTKMIAEDIAAPTGESVVIPYHGVEVSAGVYVDAISGAGAQINVELL